MPRAGSTPFLRSPPDTMKFSADSSFHKDFTSCSPKEQSPQLPLGAPLKSKSFRLRTAPSLDGGKSPFVDQREPRRETLRLPALSLTRDEDSPTPTPTSQRRRVGFSAPNSRQGDNSSISIPAAPSSAPVPEKQRRQRRREGRSIGRAERTVLFLDVEGGIARSPVKRSSRRHKTWTATTADAASTPSVLSSMETPKSSTPQTPAADVSFSFSWTKGAPIGSGSHGCVFKALDNRTGRIFAVKRGIVDDSEDDKKYRERLEEELSISKDLRHPNIVATLGFEYAANHLYIYLEYVPGGSLSSMLNEFGPLAGTLLSDATSGLVEGLNYLHTREPPVIHRDIKGANILVDLDFCVKLADFGCSKRSNVTTSFTTIGSIPWMAPEVILQQDGYGRKADVWSLGCVLIEMATAEKPWGRAAFENVMYALRHIATSDKVPPIPESLDEAGHDFASMCLKRDPEERPSAAELIGHSFVCCDELS
eukprot:gb/GFBE01010701.1/.p1 GENE.gb/GFBE01010701.1/~~gb/GFBE01010701.1/.p1  ORF type:complete len:479 (+),score=75.78 gb/GFBE01010701.1/:1-1437(+)